MGNGILTILLSLPIAAMTFSASSRMVNSLGIADIHRSCEIVVGIHAAHERLDQVIHIAERPGLRTVTIDRDVLAAQGLNDEIRNHPPVIGMHTGSVGIENSGNLDAQSVLAPVVEEQSFGAALALIVARAQSDRIGISPIGLVLGVNFRVAINFTGRRLKNFCPQAFCKPQQIDRAMYTGLGCLDGIVLIVHREAGQAKL